jgi:hypothetical protein
MMLKKILTNLKLNLSITDVKIRYVVAMLLFVIGIIIHSIEIVILSFIVYYTAVRRFCPIYYLIGLLKEKK